MNKHNCDFSGYATRNDLLCADGRTIRRDAFKDCDGKEVPLIWNHDHTTQDAVLGHALLENRKDGVYAYCLFNDTEQGQTAKKLVQHGDVRSLSIFANKLKQVGGDVIHGVIRELSLVLAGANEGAYIDSVMAHADENGYIFQIPHGEGQYANFVMAHSEDEGDSVYANYDECTILLHSDETKKEEKTVAEEEKKTTEKEETIQDVIDTMNEKQKNVMYYLVGEAKNSGSDDSKEEKEMKHNAFDNENYVAEPVLSHAAQGEILRMAKSESCGSLQVALRSYLEDNQLQHADISGFVQTGDGNITTMFPEYVEAHPSATPELITNDMGWVDAIMAKTQKIPHGRVRTSHIDIRNIDSLKAKGYKKGDKKNLTGNYSLVRRTTDPQTVYVTSELHRDDVVDIEDFDYVNFQYNIDQMSLKETLAVATMLGDDRDESDAEKIFPEHIRPVWTDDELYTIHKTIDYAAMAKELQGDDAQQYFGKNFIYAEAMVNALRMARKDFRGTGKPDLFVTTDMHNTMILARDRNGHRIYNTDTELAAALGVANIYEVPQFEGKVREDKANGNKKFALRAICVNMADYGYGCSKGGDVTHFTDFDIKFNKLQSLLETRKSGQLTRIKSAIVLEEEVVGG